MVRHSFPYSLVVHGNTLQGALHSTFDSTDCNVVKNWPPCNAWEPENKLQPPNFIFIVLFGLLFIFPHSTLATETLTAVNGTLDLRNWSPPAQGYAPVLGDWLFFWQQRLPPTTKLPATLSAQGTPRPLEQHWLGTEVNGQSISGQGFASYYLKILAPVEKHRLAVHFPRYRRAYRLWVNGQLVEESGQPHVSNEIPSTFYHERVIPLPEGASNYILVLHTANHLSFTGRVPQPMLIGTADALYERHARTILISCISLGAGLLFGLKYLLLFATKRRYAGYFWMGLFSFNIAVGQVAWVIALLPNMIVLTQEQVIRILITTTFSQLPLYILLAHSLYPKTHSTHLLWGGLIPCGLAMLVALFASVANIELMLFFTTPYPLIMHSLLIHAAWRTIQVYGKAGWWLLASILMLTLLIGHDILWNAGLFTASQPVLFNFSILLLLLAVLFDQYDIDAFQRVKELSQNLQKQVAARTQELSEKVLTLKSRETELQTAYQQLEEVNQTKTRFLAAASHDLRQPLHAMGLQLAQLKEQVENAAVYTIVTQIETAQITLSETLNALLDISKLDAGVLTPGPTHFPLRHLFTRLNDEFIPIATEKGIVLRVRPTKVWAYSDPALLFRVIANLVDNALKHSKTCGILVGVRRRGDNLHIEVRDTGVGIPVQQQATIFQEYIQLDNPGRDRRKGLGLGLSIVERLCRLLNHSLKLTSQAGRGTCIQIQVPIGNPHLALETDAAKSASNYSLQGCVVLVVDDEPDVLTATKNLLNTWKCAVLTANNLHEAVTAVEDEDIDVIVADYRLGDGHTGEEVIDAVNQATGKICKAIIVTGEVRPDALVKLRSGDYPVLNKPVAPLTLRSMLHRLLREG